MTYVGFGVMVATWLTFAALAARAPAVLDGAWRSTRALPIGLEAVVWALFLPWMIGLALWERRSWPDALRLAAVGTVAAAWLFVLLPTRS